MAERDMVEIVARAICPTAWIAEGMSPGAARVMQDHAMAGARAAIEAMREPNRAMVDAGVAFVLNVSLGGGYHWSDYVADKHRCMVDAALASSPVTIPKES